MVVPVEWVVAVAAGLGNIQKLKDGEALSSRTNAEDDFEVVEDEDFLG